MNNIPETIRSLLLSTDSCGQLCQTDLFTPQSDTAIKWQLAEEVKYENSYTWIRLTGAGLELKAKENR